MIHAGFLRRILGSGVSLVYPPTNPGGWKDATLASHRFVPMWCDPAQCDEAAKVCGATANQRQEAAKALKWKIFQGDVTRNFRSTKRKSVVIQYSTR